MKQGTISSIVTNTVILGGGTYASHVTITATGGVEPASYGSTAVSASPSLSHAKVTNAGTIHGGLGLTQGQFGGNGIELTTATGVVVNSGAITGGESTYSAYASGGIGVLLHGNGTISNTGSIDGGAGYAHPDYHQNSYPGAVGVDVTGTATLTNKGFISGGNGLNAAIEIHYYDGPAGAAGVILGQASHVTNSGTIQGGAPGGVPNKYDRGSSGGVGIDFTASGVLVNHGLIQASASSVGDQGGPPGMDGVMFTGAGTVTNTGIILGGGSFDGGGAGLALSSGTITNSGTIGGGSGGGSGVLFAAGGALTNSGAIYGTMGATLNHPDGGAGVSLVGIGSIVNQGTITGGNGATPSKAPGGNGGDGVYLGGGTLSNFGTIVAGIAGHDRNGDGIDGKAVQFGASAATLVINPDASFVGDIAANSTVVDTLELQGKGGMLSGLGTAVTGFTDFVDDPGARWTLSGSISGAGSIQIGSGGTLTLDGAVSVAQIAFVGGATAAFADPTTITGKFANFVTGDVIDLKGLVADYFKFGGGKLTLYDATKTVVDILYFTGAHTAADFALQPDGHGGTDITYTASNDAGLTIAAPHQSRSVGVQADAPPMHWLAHTLVV
jgi:hypothetical protein